MSNYTHLDPQDQDIQQNKATVLCCNCGVPMDGSTGLVLCYDCIKQNVDITKGIPREMNLSYCRNCERFLQPPSSWIHAQLESRELLAICLRRLKGLNSVRLIDASFLWTEPHSRRVRVKLTVQGEAFNNVILQQTFEVEYVVIAMQCPDCAKAYTTHTWNSSIQLRQKVPHKRTFLYLEQLILKHNAHVDTISIKEAKDGLDFFYGKQNHAIRMLDFLRGCVPIKYKKSQSLITEDSHSGTAKYKFTYSVEIAPICKEDLVVLPKKLAKSMGNISQFVICSKVTNAIQFLDPTTLKTADLQGSVFWRAPFSSLTDMSQLVEFIVLDVEPTGEQKGKFLLADITVARASDMGVNDQEYYVRSHLGAILHPGDSALGYYLANSNFNSELFDSLDTDNLPEVVLVKKFYKRTNKTIKKRQWKLKRMAKEKEEIGGSSSSRDNKQVRQEEERAEKDYEIFMEELEEDQELRQTVNLYKSEKPAEAGTETDAESEEDEDAPQIDVDELLDELDDMKLD
ncbi:ribosome-binding protein [Brettanomyces nanus]|uniref:60S ribosomal export protein NMD3 n=1 Tax=Eeniella nana TaxID=13502 RepID=A0A875RXJ8_EENNA|nr:ribosome-binding protein [Brettanomyces nanus]QPG73368.1 ribosome-binding protein [Brettanomyces nanus]